MKFIRSLKTIVLVKVANILIFFVNLSLKKTKFNKKVVFNYKTQTVEIKELK